MEPKSLVIPRPSKRLCFPAKRGRQASIDRPAAGSGNGRRSSAHAGGRQRRRSGECPPRGKNTRRTSPVRPKGIVSESSATAADACLCERRAIFRAEAILVRSYSDSHACPAACWPKIGLRAATGRLRASSHPDQSAGARVQNVVRRRCDDASHDGNAANGELTARSNGSCRDWAAARVRSTARDGAEASGCRSRSRSPVVRC